MVSIVKALLSGSLVGNLPKACAIAAASTLMGTMAMPVAVRAQTLYAQTVDVEQAEEAPAEENAAEGAVEETGEGPTVDVIPADSQPPAEAPGATRAVGQSDSPIGIAAGQALMSEAESEIGAQNYTAAAEKLVEARKALNDVSTHYQSIAAVFVGVDSRVTSALRARALEAAEIRDQASYQLAVVYRAQSRPDLAVPLLVEVVQSQQPTRPVGQKAYQQLYELGFVEVPYDAPSAQ